MWFWELDATTYLWIFGFLAVYFFPSFMGLAFRHKDWGGIILFNFLIGWTVVGWFLVLNWAVGTS